MAHISVQVTHGFGCWLLRIVTLSVAIGVAHSAEARPFRVLELPNGEVKSCDNCHVTPGGVRNAFGQTVEQGFLIPISASGHVQWGPALAAIDSDGDGRTNGQELLDPTGSWSAGQANPGQPSWVRNPGVIDPAAAVPTMSRMAFALLAASLGWLGTVRRPRKKA